jgi:hypothetical protein
MAAFATNATKRSVDELPESKCSRLSRLEA